MNDQGDFLDDLLGADNNLPIDDQPIIINTQANVSGLLEEAHADVRGFADNYIDNSRQQNELRDMFKVQ